MITNLIILLIIVIIIFNSVIYNIQHRCPEESIKINYVRAARMPSTKSKEIIGITIINLKLDRDVPCGIYEVDTSYGKSTLYVSKNSLRIGYLNYPSKMVEFNSEMNKEINNTDLFDLWNLDKISGKKSNFVNTYNQGCC